MLICKTGKTHYVILVSLALPEEQFTVLSSRQDVKALMTEGTK